MTVNLSVSAVTAGSLSIWSSVWNAAIGTDFVSLGSWTTSAPPAPALTIRSDHSSDFTQGQLNASYSLTVSNGADSGPTSNTVSVTETVPSGLSFVSMSGVGWACSTNTCTRSDLLPPGASYPPIIALVNVSPSAPSSVTNSAAVTGGATASDPTAIHSIVAATASATYLTLDTTTQGNWKSAYGVDGAFIPTDANSIPAYAQFAIAGQSLSSWTSSTSDVRGLQKFASSTDRTAPVWYSFSNFTIDLNLTDGAPHQIALYCVDWDTSSRAQTVQVLDAYSSAVLDSQAMPSGQSPRTYSQLFPTASGSSETPFKPKVVASVVLPDNISQYTFQYNAYGELVRVTLPTGGAFEYDYPDSMPVCSGNTYLYGCVDYYGVPVPADEDMSMQSVFRRVKERRILPDGTNVESKTTFTPIYTAGGTGSTVVTVEVKNASGTVLKRDIHTFSGNAADLSPYPLRDTTLPYPDWRTGKETQTDSVKLENGITARSVVNLYGQGPWSGDPAIPHDVKICQSNVTLTETTGQSTTSGSIDFYDQYSNLTEKYEFGYDAAPTIGSSCQTATSQRACESFSGYSRCTHQEYLADGYDLADSSSSTAAGLSLHLRNLVTDQQVYDTGSVLVSHTESLYDDDYSARPLKDTSGIANHLPSYGIGYYTRGNLTTVRKWNTGSSAIDLRNTFDVAGNLVATQDGNLKKTSITYNSPTYAFANSVCKNVSGQDLCFTQDFDTSTGQLISRSDLNSMATTFDYTDSLDRLKTATRPDGSKVVFNYTNSNTLITSTSDQDAVLDGKLKTEKLLDGLGRELETRQYEDATHLITVRKEYDSLGRPYRVYNPYRSGDSQIYTATTYDSLGRVLSVTTPDSAATTYSYVNNKTTITDPDAKKRTSETDALGRLTKVIENPDITQPPTTTYTYNAAGSLTNVHQTGSLNDPALPDRTFTYDLLQRLLTATNPETGTITYEYDKNSNLSKKTDANLVQTFLTYNEMDQLLTKEYVIAGAIVPTDTVEYTYSDAAVSYSKGRLTRISNGNVWQVGTFDVMGRPTSSSQTTAGVTYPSFGYTYNLAGALQTITYPSGHTYRTDYDQAGRINKVSRGTTTYASVPQDFASQTYGYAPHGAVQRMTIGALVEQTCYNSRFQATAIRLGASATSACINGGNDPLRLTFDYGGMNNNGNLRSQTIARQAQSWTQNYTQTAYDPMNRLMSFNEGTVSQTYSYDGYGNRAVTHGVINDYATPTALTQYNNNRWWGTGANYDNAGNQTALPARSYKYDAENRLVWTQVRA